MSLFHGVHEVRMLKASGVAVGYFSEWTAALAAVAAEPSQYKGAYFTLNPIALPAGAALNPASLNPARGAAADADIVRRVWLLVDIDPPRAAKTNASEAEKQIAHEQAERVREWLRSQSWPEPWLCDSGNGWHLLYRIELPNDAASAELIKSILAGLKLRFPMVDSGNFNASRICKLYGSWARKAEHSDERPWRLSRIVEVGSDTPVTEAQLRALCPVSVVNTGTLSIDTDHLKLVFLLGFLEHYSIVIRSQPKEIPGGWRIEVECPWLDEHGDESPRDTVVSFIAGRGFGFSCLHQHCIDRHWHELAAEMIRRNPGLPTYFHRLPALNNSDIAKQFILDHDDFVRLYDSNNATAVWMPGIRWTLSDPGDALLRRAIRRYLDELHDRYGAPEPGHKDRRSVLKQAAFLSAVLVEVKPWLPPQSVYSYDIDEAILPLPDGKVADLRHAIVRPMEREDMQSKRLKLMPRDIPTPRWDRFIREITCGDEVLGSFLRRICAAAITGRAFHDLIFFYGSGRNGKGFESLSLRHFFSFFD